MSKTCLVGPDTGMFFYSYYFGFGPCQQERLRFFFFYFFAAGNRNFPKLLLPKNVSVDLITVRSFWEMLVSAVQKSTRYLEKGL